MIMTECLSVALCISLEAATSRLEDIALAQQSQQTIGHIPGPSALPAAAPAEASRAGTAPANAANAGATASKSGSSDSPAVSAFKELLAGPLDKYASLSKGIGGVVAEQACDAHNKLTSKLTSFVYSLHTS